MWRPVERPGARTHPGFPPQLRVAGRQYLEICGWCATSLGALEYMVEKLGADRILFGIDFVWIGAPFQLGAIAYADISDEDKRKIFGLNALRLFGLSSSAI